MDGVGCVSVWGKGNPAGTAWAKTLGQVLQRKQGGQHGWAVGWSRGRVGGVPGARVLEKSGKESGVHSHVHLLADEGRVSSYPHLHPQSANVTCCRFSKG